MREYWLPLPDFADKYSISLGSIHAGKHTGVYPKDVFRKANEKDLEVNEMYFKRRHDFHQKIWIKSHELYEELMEMYPTEYAMSFGFAKISGESRSSWYTFISVGLWNIPQEGVNNIHINRKLYMFYRYGKWIKSLIKKHHRVLKQLHQENKNDTKK